MSLSRAGLVASLAAALAACVSTSPKPTAARGPSARELFPLAVGNRWTYDVSFLGARQALTVSIVSGEGGEFVDSRNQRFSVGPGGVRDEHRYLLREPIEVGRGWSSIINVTTTEDYHVEEIGIRMDVPAGHFEDCVRVEAKSPQGQNMSLIADQVYCPGVGLVRVITFQERSGVRGPAQVTQELSSYRVAR